MLKRTLVVFAILYAVLLLLSLPLIFFGLRVFYEGYRRQEIQSLHREQRLALEMETEKVKAEYQQRMSEIEESEERRVDEEALEQARAALEGLIDRMQEKFDSWYDQTDAVAETVSHLESPDEVRAYFESVLELSKPIQRLMLYQFKQEEKGSRSIQIVLDAARPALPSLEGKSFYLNESTWTEPGFKQMHQRLWDAPDQARVVHRANLPLFASWEQPYGLIEVRFERDELLRTLVNSSPPFGYGFGLYADGLPEQGITSFPEIAYKTYEEIAKREMTDDVWEGNIGGMPSQLIVGQIPGWKEEAAILVVGVEWDSSYGFHGMLTYLMPAGVIYSTDWKEKELAELAAKMKQATGELIELQRGHEAKSEEMLTAVKRRLQILMAQFFLATAVFLFFWLIIPAFVYADAAKLGLPAGLWAFLVFVSSLIGLVVYLLVRPRSRVVCHECGGPIETDFAVCPACGAELKATCPSCGKTVTSEWRVCPYCRNQLS